jgi:Mrp family chromosome partitioning ATPase
VKVKQYQGSLTQISSRLATLPLNDPNRAALSSQVSTLTNQINTLTTRQNQLATTTISAGRIISDSALPKSPVRPSVPLFAASGALLGLLLGAAVAAVRQRLDRRVRRAADLTRRADVPVLAQLPSRTQIRYDDVFPPFGPAGRMFNRLRNEALATLRADDQVIVVAGATRGTASTLVAANLAASLGRSGSEVVLVCAHLPENLLDTAPAIRLLGVRATPGLSDVLAGKVSLDEAVQRAPRNPWLRVLTTGGTASAAGLLQSAALRDTLDRLRGEAEFIVIEAPSTAASADAQSLASLADVAILVVELRRTAHAEVVDAAEQLRRVGTPLLGAVVMPRLVAEAPPVTGRPAHATALETAQLEHATAGAAAGERRADGDRHGTGGHADPGAPAEPGGHVDANGHPNSGGHTDSGGHTHSGGHTNSGGRSEPAVAEESGAVAAETGTESRAGRPASALRPFAPSRTGSADETLVMQRIDDVEQGDKAKR